MVTERVLTRLTNEVVVMVPEYDMTTALLTALRRGGTGQITVDNVVYRKSPYGTGVIFVTATVTRRGAASSDLRAYVRRVLEANGHEAPAERVTVPARPRTARVLG